MTIKNCAFHKWGEEEIGMCFKKLVVVPNVTQRGRGHTMYEEICANKTIR